MPDEAIAGDVGRGAHAHFDHRLRGVAIEGGHPTDRVVERRRSVEELLRAMRAHENAVADRLREEEHVDRKSTRLNSSHANISYAVFCLKKKKNVTQYLVKTSTTNLNYEREEH